MITFIWKRSMISVIYMKTNKLKMWESMESSVPWQICTYIGMVPLLFPILVHRKLNNIYNWRKSESKYYLINKKNIISLSLELKHYKFIEIQTLYNIYRVWWQDVLKEYIYKKPASASTKCLYYFWFIVECSMFKNIPFRIIVQWVIV